MTTADYLEGIINSKEEIRRAIVDKGVEVATGTKLVDFADKIRDIPTGGGVGWQPRSDWWDIKKIFEDDPNPDKRFIILLSDDDFRTTTTQQMSFGNAGASFKRSDGTTYTTSTSLPWDTTKDKFCSDGYKTRYVICYKSDPNVQLQIQGTACLFIYVGNNTEVENISGNSSTTVTSAALLFQSIKYDSTVRFDTISYSDYIFNSCISLAEITIPNGVKNLTTYSCQNCYSASVINIPNTLISIAAATFNNCIGVISINIPFGWVVPANFNVSACIKWSISSMMTFLYNVGYTSVARTITIGSTNLAKLNLHADGKAAILYAQSQGYTIA